MYKLIEIKERFTEDELERDDMEWLIEKVEGYEKTLNFAVKYLQSSDIKQVQMVVNRLKEELNR